MPSVQYVHFLAMPTTTTTPSPAVEGIFEGHNLQELDPQYRIELSMPLGAVVDLRDAACAVGDCRCVLFLCLCSIFSTVHVFGTIPCDYLPAISPTYIRKHLSLTSSNIRIFCFPREALLTSVSSLFDAFSGDSGSSFGTADEHLPKVKIASHTAAYSLSIV